MMIPLAAALARASVLHQVDAVSPWAPPVEDRPRSARTGLRLRGSEDGTPRRP